MSSKHIPIVSLFVVVALAMSINCFAGSTAREWAKITKPTQIGDSGQSIGTYNAGCLGGAAVLPLEGEGYQVMRLSRKRYYGHTNLIQFNS